LDHFAAPVFEQVCQQYFWRASLKGELPFVPLKIGGWWQANEEIDLVLVGTEEAMLVECKWSSRPVGIDILEELEGKSGKVLQEAGLRKASFAICARSGFTDPLRNLASERDNLTLLDWPEMLSG
jgi:hypothetical protein